MTLGLWDGGCGCSGASGGCSGLAFTGRQRRRNTESGFAAFPCHEQRGLAVAQLFLNMSREWVWKEIFPFPEAAKLQRPQLFSTAGPKCWAANGGLFPFYCLPVLSCRAASRPTPGTGVREIARFNYKVSEMEEKKKNPLHSPPCPHPSCVLRVEEQQVLCHRVSQ